MSDEAGALHTALPYGRYAEQAPTLGLSFALPGHDPPGPFDEVDRPPGDPDARLS